MIRVLAAIEKALKPVLIDSFLARTAPSTRLLISVLLSVSIVSSSYIALGLISSVILVLILCSLDTLWENRFVVTTPLLTGVIIAIFAVLWPEEMETVQPIMLIWKFFIFCLAAAIWLILLPPKDITSIARRMRYPQVLALVIAAFRAVEVGGWIADTVVRTRRSKRVRFLQETRLWFDGLATSAIGHLIEFIDGFAITLRTRGVESKYVPRDGGSSIDGYDFFAYAICLLGVFAVIKL